MKKGSSLNVHLDEPTINNEISTYSLKSNFKSINIHTKKNDIKINDFKSQLCMWSIKSKSR